jgi:hypothetical protein
MSTRTLLPAVAGCMLLLGDQASFATDSPVIRVAQGIRRDSPSAIFISLNTPERMTAYCRNAALRSTYVPHDRRTGHYDAVGLHGRSLIPGDLTGPRDRFPDERGRHRSAQSTNTAAAAGVHPLGRKSVLVLTLRSSSNTTRCTNATMNAIVFTDKRSDSHYSGSVAGYYSENSYGQMTMSGDVSGPYMVDMTVACTLSNMQKWADAADSGAAAAGVNVAAYDAKLYMLPPESTTKCSPWGGWTEDNRVWVRDDQCDAKFILAHELGHTFGASHASIPGSTNSARYGDASSVMGGLLLPADSATSRPPDPSTFDLWNSTAHFNAPGKIDLGWLPAQTIQTVTVGGRYKIAMLERTPSSDIQVLRIGTTFFSYRRAVGYDADLRKQYVDNTSVHTGGNGDETILLANLGDGQSFTDGLGMTVTQTRHDSLFAYLTVSMSAPHGPVTSTSANRHK